MTGELVAQMSFPPEWLAGHEWLHTEVVLVLRHEATDTQVIAAGGVLTNGSNLICLCWDGGQNVARLNADEGWALEEQVDPSIPVFVQPVWRQVVDSLIIGKREAAQ